MPITPKQKRSEITQAKILSSLNNCLQNKYFEHISINELAEGAGVSVGTFYRRFKDKNALIPLLYDQLGEQLSDWITEFTKKKSNSVEQAVHYLCTEVSAFIKKREGVFRTLHLYTRLHTELVAKDQMSDRVDTFSPIVSWLHEQIFSSGNTEQHRQKLEMWMFVIFNTLIEKNLYQDITPASVCDMSINLYIDQITAAITNDIKDLK